MATLLHLKAERVRLENWEIEDRRLTIFAQDYRGAMLLSWQRMQFSMNTFNILALILSFNIPGTLASFTSDLSGKIFVDKCVRFFKQF